MSLIKRITTLITPAGGVKARKSDTTTAPQVDETSASNILPILTALTGTTERPVEETRADLARLRRIATKYGAAWTASEIQDSLLRMPDEDENDVPLKKGRGYELAADLYRQSLQKRMTTLETDRATVDVADFGRLARELVACLHAAGKFTKGIDLLVNMTDASLLSACDRTQVRSLRLSLAMEALKSAYRWSFDQHERVQQAYHRAKREEKQFDTPPPEDLAQLSAKIDIAVLEYLNDLTSKLAQVDQQLETLGEGPPVAFRDVPTTTDDRSVKQELKYVHQILALAEKLGHSALRAQMLGLAGVLQATTQPGAGRDAFLEAARLLEAQGDAERELGLASLSQRRYHRASELFQRAGSDEATRIKDKLHS